VARRDVDLMPLPPLKMRLPQLVRFDAVEAGDHVEVLDAAAVAAPRPAEVADALRLGRGRDRVLVGVAVGVVGHVHLTTSSLTSMTSAPTGRRAHSVRRRCDPLTD
jgi:hypothetical protein